MHQNSWRAAAVLSAVAALSLSALPAQAVTSTVDLTTLTPNDLASTLLGAGVTASNVTYTGAPVASGTFSGGAASVGFDTGVILTSGSAAGAMGPNSLPNTTTANGLAGDADLTALSSVPTRDASVLEFDFTPNADTVYFEYVFGSEEYLEFVGSDFNDSFAFFVNGVNYATVDNGGVLEPITINNINPGSNASLYVDNPGTLNVEYDGLTTVLTFMAPVNTGVPNHIKLAIADGSDEVLDSGVFLKAGSFSTTPPAGPAKVTGGGKVAQSDGDVTLGTQVIRDEQGLRGNLQVNDHRNGARFHGHSVDSFSVTGSTATWTGQGRLDGADGYTFTATVADNRQGNSAKKGSADTVQIVIRDAGGAIVWENASLDLWGNVTVHQE
ncbi:choice-of-anchor L domain-containing protein [Sinomonas mesophila]|uniref:choice-of-anchor L domain-containing protein n=1 Tax=Sinomonas mesophila TaxID=1531955 RepID=UPI0011157638|nr:choice-of-anchor L domain-containing protein [Sinomonas mesophila]